MPKADVIVIGAGAAGLTAGAILAKEGKRVTVLDRAPYLGGRGMAVPDEGFKLNLGGHLLEDSGSGITKVFEYLGKSLVHGPANTDMNVWDHERSRWGSIRDRYSGNKDELKKVIKAIVETPYEELDRWDDRCLREWILQYTSDEGVIDLFEFISVLECMTEDGGTTPRATTSTCARCTTRKSEWPRTRSGRRRAGTGSSRISRTR